MSDNMTYAEAAALAGPNQAVPAPPRPGQGAAVNGATTTSTKRTDVTVVSNSKKPVHVDVDGGNGWPRDPEEWKRLLAKAAPWLVGAALLAVGVNQYKKNTGVEGKARRGAKRAANAVDDAAECAKHGWFGLKRRTNQAADSAGNKAHDAKRAAGKKAEEAKDSARNVADQAKHAANDAAASAKQGAKQGAAAASNAAHDVKEWTKDKAGDVADVARNLESAAYSGVNKGVAQAGSLEEKTGRAMKKAGERIEKAGRDTKNFYGEGEVPARKKFLGIF